MQEVIIDVRDPEKYRADHAQGAINVPHTDIVEGRIPIANKDAKIVAYCSTGNKAARMKAELEKQGYTNVRSTSRDQLK